MVTVATVVVMVMVATMMDSVLVAMDSAEVMMVATVVDSVFVATVVFRRLAAHRLLPTLECVCMIPTTPLRRRTSYGRVSPSLCPTQRCPS